MGFMRMTSRCFITLIVLLIAGCNRDPKSRRDKYFSDAQRYHDKGAYNEATIQYRNALQIDADHIPSYLGLAEVFKKTGDHENAISAYRKVVDLDPQNVEARLEVGTYFLNQAAGNTVMLKTAESIALEVIEIQPSNIDGRVLLGNVYSGLGDVDKSISELQTAVSQDPAHLYATISLGAAHLRAGHVEEAERIFKSVLEKHPESIEALLALATFLRGTQRFDEAETYFKKAFALAPVDARSLYGLASFYSSTNKIEQAENVFKEAIAQKPDEREPRWGLVNFYSQQGDQDRARTALLDLLKAKPGDRLAQLRLAEHYLNAKKPAEADEMLRSVLKTFPDDANAHAVMGRLLREQNNLDKAAAEFDAAIKADDSLIPPYIEKANLQMIAGNLDGAHATLTTALQRSKDDLLVRGFLAKILALQQKPEDALRESAIVLAAMPTNEDAIVARGDAYIILGNLDEAAKQFRKLSEGRPTYSYYWHRLGIAQAMRGDNANAAVNLRKAVDLKPDFTSGINDLVMLHVRLKQFDTALLEAERLSKTSTSADQMHRLRGQVYAVKGDSTSAESEFRKAIELNPESYVNYMALAELSMARRDLQQAIREIDRLIAKNNRHAQAFFMKGYFLQLTHDNAAAIMNYRKALELDSESPEVANNLAWLLSEDPMNLSEALGLAEKARRMRPTDPEFADTLGWVYYKMKNYTLAVDQLLFSLKNRPRAEAEHYFRLGLAYHGKGDLKSAQTTLRKALEVNPSFPGAAEARRLLDSQS